MSIDRPLTGRIIPPGEPLGANPEPINHRVLDSSSAEQPTTEPAPAPVERPAPPDVIEVHVHIAPGADMSPVEADDTKPWWIPAYPLRTAIVGALGFMPLPSIGAPAAHWALFVGDATAEQSLGAGWTIATAGILGALAIDRRSRRWDNDEHAWRPGWIARGLLCTAVSGACLALPVFDSYVALTTGAN